MSVRSDLEDLRGEVQRATTGHTTKLDDASALVASLLPRLGRLTGEHLLSLLDHATHVRKQLEERCRQLCQEAENLFSSRLIDAAAAAACHERMTHFVNQNRTRHEDPNVKIEPFGLLKLAKDIEAEANAAAARLKTIQTDLVSLLIRQSGLRFRVVQQQPSDTTSSYYQMLEALDLELSQARSLYAAHCAGSNQPSGPVAEHLERAEAIAGGLEAVLQLASPQMPDAGQDLSGRQEAIRKRLQQLARACTRYPRARCRHGVSPWQWRNHKRLRAIVSQPVLTTEDTQLAESLLTQIESYCLTAENRRDLHHYELTQREIAATLRLDQLTANGDVLLAAINELEFVQDRTKSFLDGMVALSQRITEGRKACADYEFTAVDEAIHAAINSLQSLRDKLQRLQKLDEQLRIDRNLEDIAANNAASRRAVRLAKCQQLGIELIKHIPQLASDKDEASRLIAEVAGHLARISYTDDETELLEIEDRLILLSNQFRSIEDLYHSLRELFPAEQELISASA